MKLEAYYEGHQAGRERGIEQGCEQEARGNIRSLILNLPDADEGTIANLLSKPVALVAEVRDNMKAEAQE